MRGEDATPPYTYTIPESEFSRRGGAADAAKPFPSHFRSLTAAFAFAAPLAAAAPPSQINIHYTQTPGTLSVDFVSQAADGVVQFGASANPDSFKNSTTTSFAFNEVGVLHQGLMAFAAAPAGASGFYRCCSGGECSTVNHVVPNVAAGKERFAVFGDFGIINDESMTDLIAQAAKGSYDSVLHVGDWAYDLDALASTVGNAFMETATYMAIKPVAVVEGNHEACPLCLQNVPEIPFSVGNFTVRFFLLPALALRRDAARCHSYFLYSPALAAAALQGALPLRLAELEHGQQ